MKKGWRKALKVCLWALGSVAAPVLLYLGAAILLGLVPVNRGFESREGGTEVYLVSNGVHVDFLLPARTPLVDLTERFPPDRFAVVDSAHAYLAFGWGERTFYLETPAWDDAKVSTIAKALLWPTPSVMHVQYVRFPPPAGDDVRRVALSDEQYRTLVRLILRSFQTASDGAFVLIPGRGYGETDNFYEGAGTYHAFNTCNVWTNRLLGETGVTTAAWSPFTQGIMRHLK